MATVKYIVTAHPANNKDRKVEQELSTREQRERWIEKLKENGWRVISKTTKVVG